MVGFDRALYPIDIWALPFSMLQLKERNAYVPLVEDQYSSTVPLPFEWLNVKMHNADARRGKTMVSFLFYVKVYNTIPKFVYVCTV